MAHIIINPSLSAAIAYNFFLNPPKCAVVIAILEPANSTRTDNSTFICSMVSQQVTLFVSPVIVISFFDHLYNFFRNPRERAFCW